MADEFKRMVQIYGSVADWGSNDLVLSAGEIGFALQGDGKILGKIGDGSSAFSALDYTIGTDGLPIEGAAWGVVADDGTLTGGSRCTTAKQAVGQYRITFTDVATGAARRSVTANPLGSASVAERVKVGEVSTSAWDVFLFDGTGTAVDAAFSFNSNAY